LGRPVYVVGFAREENALIVGPAEALARRGMTVQDVRYIAGRPPGETFEAEVQIRYRARPARGEIRTAGNGAEARVVFQRPQAAVTPGQAAVFYEGERVIGGGLIKEAH